MKDGSFVKILLVDDRAENLLALEVILSNRNYLCVKANSGKEALKILLYQQDFALILMDVQMPIMDGFETVELIRQSEKLKHVPIIFLTANMDTSEHVFKGYQTGAVEYMIKPISPIILRAKVAFFVDLYEKNHELLIQKEQLNNFNSQLNKQSLYVRSLIEASLDPFIVISSEGKITDLNDALANILCITRDRLIDTLFFDYFTNPKKARQVFEEVIAHGSIMNTHLTLRNNEGKLIDMLCNGSVYKNESGQVLGVLIVAREKLYSKYSRTLIEASLDTFITVNTEGKITDMNEALAKKTGLPREKLTDTDFKDYFMEGEKASDLYQKVFANGVVTDYPLTMKNAKMSPVLFNGSVYKDELENVLGAIMVGRDITEQKRIEKELIEAKVAAEEAKSKAEDAAKAKQQFLSNMSHEIRTPLNAIIGFTKVIQKTSLSPTQKEYLSAIKMGSDTLIVLINDILDLAKVDSGKMTFENKPFRLSDSIAAMVHLFNTKIQEKNLEMVSICDPKIPPVIAGDSVRLHQIIMNLVSNAIRFTDTGQITIHALLLEDKEHSVRIEFSVTDTGIGIAKESLNSIFETFQQASSNTSRKFGGTGLGLSIVKQLVEAQGGSVHVKSKVGKGSTFSFVLNFDKTDDAVAEEFTMVEPEKVVEDINVLVVEDMALNQLLIKVILDDFGFKHDIASNGKIALEKLQTGQYDIILMDLQMPVLNGFETTRHIREIMKSDIPIMALTADVTTVDLDKCRAVGMDDYIAKPIEENILYAKMTGLVKKKPLSKGQKKKDNIQLKKLKYTDLDYLASISNSDPAFMVKMISLYLEQTPELISTMKQGWKDKDWNLLYFSTHNLISSFSILGIGNEVKNMAIKIQKCALTQHPMDEIDDFVSQIENACVQACEELEQELNAIKSTNP